MGSFPPNKYKYTDTHYVMGFGKFHGQSIKSVIENNPGYIKWCLENIPEFEICDGLSKLLDEKGIKIDLDKKLKNQRSQEKMDEFNEVYNSGFGTSHPDYNPDRDIDQQEGDIW
jgi:hypothetical protein